MAPRQPGKTTKKKAVAARPAEVDPLPDTAQPAEVLRREVLAGDDLVRVPLGPSEEIVECLPSRQWRSSAIHALNTGDFETWAEGCLTEDGYDVWHDVDPTAEEIEEFLKSFKATEGIHPLQSRASRRASMRNRRR
jgi:hypothetical protein